MWFSLCGMLCTSLSTSPQSRFAEQTIVLLQILIKYHFLWKRKRKCILYPSSLHTGSGSFSYKQLTHVWFSLTAIYTNFLGWRFYYEYLWVDSDVNLFSEENQWLHFPFIPPKQNQCLEHSKHPIKYLENIWTKLLHK